MNRRNFYFLFLFFITLFVGQLFADPIQFTNTYHESEFRKLLDLYYEESSVPNTIFFKYKVNDQVQIATKHVLFRAIVVGDLSEYTPKITNPHADDFSVSAEFKKVYFLKRIDLLSHKDITDKLGVYYDALPFNKPYDLKNKNIVLDKLLLPITKENLISFLESTGVTDPDSIFKLLVDKKILVEYPMILEINSEYVGNDFLSLPRDLSFEINFTPAFASPVKPITGKILFKKEPLKITSKYSLPAPDCKTNPSLNHCYITTNDISQFNAGEITTPEITERDNKIRSWLNNFNVVSGFKEQSFEGINTKELLVKLSLKREHFCFREGNDKYTDTIFRVAKAYNLSMEQAFQLWAIISERSNCNNNLNPDLYGFAQVDLKGRDSGNLINIEEIISNSQPKLDSRCSKCGEGYFMSETYPTKGVVVGKTTGLKQGDVCYKCISSEKAQRCNANTGEVGGITTLLDPLKKEICPNIDNAQTDSVPQSTIFTTLPLQLAEEELFQYLALGDFKEINKHLLNDVYGGDNSKFYNLGYKGIINNDNGYFGFLINSIRKNKKEDFGSTVLFTSDYLKELNFLVKNSRAKSMRPFVFEDFIVEKPNSINSIYVLSSVFNSDKEDIYGVGDFLEIFDVGSFFLKENNYIKSTKEIRVLLNYLAIKRKYYRDPQYFLKYNLSTDFPESKSKTYEDLDHKYWDTKKDIYLKTLEDNNIKLMLKKDLDLYNYDKLLQVPAKVNFPVKYVFDFGQTTYVDGRMHYLNPGAHAWSFDTKQEALDNYTLVWEASDVCLGKTVCEENDFIGKNCCKENKGVQDGTRRYKYSDILVDGAIIGIHNPTSKYDDENREYTHLAIYIGKTTTGLPLIAKSTASGQKINILTKEIKNRIKRIYVPKATNIKNIKDIINNSNKIPPAYIKLTENQIKEVNNIPKGTEYYEDPNVEGEGDIKSLEQNEFAKNIAERARHYANIGLRYVKSGRNSNFVERLGTLNPGVDCVGLLYVVMRDLKYIDESVSCKEVFENDCIIADFIEPVKKKDPDLRKGHILGIVDTIETKEDLDKLQPGDFLFLHTKKGCYFCHAGIYDKTLENGDHQYIHASGPGGPSKVVYSTFEEKLNDRALNLPFHYGRITQIDMDNIDCSSNFQSYYKRKKSCCQVTDYCQVYSRRK